MRFTYLMIDVASFIVPFVFTFHSKLRFDKKWKAFLPILLAVAVLFCAWDAVFVHLGVWRFNEQYITGIKIYDLPIEEILFFICIPYACVFTYHCFGIFLSKETHRVKTPWMMWLLSVSLIVGAIIFRDNLYPAVTFAFLAITLFILAREDFMRTFFFTYLIMLLPFFVVNGILTGIGLDEPVVWYNSNEITGFRLLTIPFEDVFYGMLLILLNVAGMEWLLKKEQ